MAVSVMIANDVCVAVPSGEMASRTERTGTPGEPQQRFADILSPASAGIESRTYKNVAGDASNDYAGSSLPSDPRVPMLKAASERPDEGMSAVGIGVAVWIPPGPARGVEEDGPAGGVGKESTAGSAQSTSAVVTPELAKAGLRTGSPSPSPGRHQQSHTRVSSDDGSPTQSQVPGSKGFTIVSPRAAATPQVPPPVHGDIGAQKSGLQAGQRGARQWGNQKLPNEIKAGQAASGHQSVKSNRGGGDPPAFKPTRDAARSEARVGAFVKNETVVSGPTAGREPVQSGPQFTFAGNSQGAANVHAGALPAPAGGTAPLSQHVMAEPQAGAGGASAENAIQSVGEQILDSMRASLDRGDNELVVRLHPPELGTVLVRFRENGEQISGLLEVSRNDTRHEIEQVLPPVLRSLQEAGIQMEKLEVVLSGQPERDFARGQPQQDARPQQHGSSPDQGFLPSASAAHSHSTGMGYPTDWEERTDAEWQSDAMRGRINMLL